jgi:hypothetical protein
VFDAAPPEEKETIGRPTNTTSRLLNLVNLSRRLSFKREKINKRFCGETEKGFETPGVGRFRFD